MSTYSEIISIYAIDLTQEIIKPDEDKKDKLQPIGIEVKINFLQILKERA